MLGTLNVIQTIPAIALFGILMAPLAALAARLPAAAALGISGILAGTSSDPHVLRLLPPFILEDEHVELLRDTLRELPP